MLFHLSLSIPVLSLETGTVGACAGLGLPVGAQFALTVVEQTQVDVAPTFSQSPRPTLGSPSSQG